MSRRVLLAAVLTLAGTAHAQETAPAPAGPLPIMVVVLPSGRVADEVVAAAQQALVDQVTAMSGGRPVHALAAPEVQTALAACRDDACVGQILATANAQAGVVLRLRPRARRPFEATLELRDPVSGAPRLAAVTGEVPTDPAQIPAALSALSAQLTDAMPAPPPPPATLLVTVNEDGATVRIDGNEVGTSPMAPIEVSEGAHDVDVTLSGHQSTRRRVEVRRGEQARLDVTLSELGAVPAGGGQPAEDGAGFFEPQEERAGGDITGEWWFWAIIGGGAALILGLAIGIGVAVSSQPQGPPVPMGIMLPPIEGGP